MHVPAVTWGLALNWASAGSQLTCVLCLVVKEMEAQGVLLCHMASRGRARVRLVLFGTKASVLSSHQLPCLLWKPPVAPFLLEGRLKCEGAERGGDAP